MKATTAVAAAAVIASMLGACAPSPYDTAYAYNTDSYPYGYGYSSGYPYYSGYRSYPTGYYAPRYGYYGGYGSGPRMTIAASF